MAIANTLMSTNLLYVEDTNAGARLLKFAVGYHDRNDSYGLSGLSRHLCEALATAHGCEQITNDTEDLQEGEGEGREA